MPSATIVRRISPMLAVANMDESIAFYQNVLGFAIAQQSPEYSVIERDGQTIHLQRAASDEIVKTLRNHVEIYIEVSGIQQLWQHVQSFQKPLSAPRFIRTRLRHDRISRHRSEFVPGLRRRTHRSSSRQRQTGGLIVRNLSPSWTFHSTPATLPVNAFYTKLPANDSRVFSECCVFTPPVNRTDKRCWRLSPVFRRVYPLTSMSSITNCTAASSATDAAAAKK